MKLRKAPPITEENHNGIHSSSIDHADDKENSFLLNALRENDSRHIQLLQGLPAAVYTCNAKGQVIFYNDAAAKLWGRHPEIGKDLWCGSWKIYQVNGEPMPLDECPMAIALKEGRAVHGHEIVVERPDGKRVNILPHPRPLFDSKGTLTGAVNMLIDITDLKRANNGLKESEERFRSMADQAPVIVWMTDEEGNINYLNKKWSETTGKNAIDGIGKGWINFIHPEDQPLVVALWMDFFSERKKCDISFRYKKNSNEYLRIKITGSPRYNISGQFVGYIGVMQDVTLQEMAKSSLEKEVNERTEDLLRKNEELRRSEERYHRMISEVQDYAIVLLSKEGIIENWNSGAEKIKGYKAHEIIGKNFRTFYTEEDRKRKLPDSLIEQATTEGRAVHDGWRVRKDGTKFWGSIVITALHNDAGDVIGFSKVTRDLTERRNNEVRLQEKNKTLEAMNQELASFAYVSSHDLQEPLRKIQTFASRIIETENDNLSAKGKDYFMRMQNAALRMQTLIEDLLTYSRTNTTEKKFEPTNLGILLEETINEMSEAIEEKNANIKFSPLPVIEVIPFQIKQLFMNLISNSLKFSKTDEAPQFSIKAGKVPGSAINNGFAIVEKMYHHIVFQDNGIGFEPEHSQKIFEIFQRLHGRSEYSGTGIGLSICKKIMDNHEGIITAESELDKGAAFHLYFPVME